MKKIIILFFFLIFFAGLWWVGKNYLLLGAKNPLVPGKLILVQTDDNPTALSESSAGTVANSVPFRVEPFVQNLKVPWSLVFTAPNRILLTERPGIVKEVVNGQLNNTPLRRFAEVSSKSEEGLMGMALHPDYEHNRYLYLCLAYQTDGKTFDRVIRVTDHNQTLDEDVIIIDKLPAAQFHAGCRLRIGPDNKLYVSTGDATDRKIAQDTKSFGGKILRLNLDGSFPDDNPFPNSPVYTYGHRNPQGFDWQPETGLMIGTEHGPSGFDGPGGGDEVNHLEAGKNYGWPVVSHLNSNPGMVDPLIVFTPAVAPASGMFYRGSVFPQFNKTFLFGVLKGEGIVQVIFDPQNLGKVSSYQKLDGIKVGRVRDIVEGPDGLIYFTTSNQDGRGKAQAGDDKIYRLVPAQ